MKSTLSIPLTAALLLTTAAVAQDSAPAPTEPMTPPAASDPSPGTAPTPPVAPTVTPAPQEMPSTAATDTPSAPILSDEQARALKDKAVWTSDQKNVGEVADVVRDSDGRVKELHADIGGFLGFGETRVRVSPDEFNMLDDRIVLTRTQAQVETLPKVIEN